METLEKNSDTEKPYQWEMMMLQAMHPSFLF